MDDIDAKSRRLVMKNMTLLAAVVIVPFLAVPRRAVAAKLSRADVNYQDQPNAGKDCDDCIQFIPDAARKAVGTCKVVAGSTAA